MPNSHIDDEKLSSLLNESEPPRSPKHLDESILSYARKQAARNRQSTEVDKQSSSDIRWYRQKWVPATVTFSMAAIAVTVTLQNFGPEDFDRSVPEFASQPEIVLRDDLAGVAVSTVEISQRTVAELSPAEPALENVQPPGDNLQSLQANDAVSTIAEADQITDAAQNQQQIVDQLNEVVGGPTTLDDQANATAVTLANPTSQTAIAFSTTQAEDEAITSADADNNSRGAGLALSDTPATIITSVQRRREPTNQAPLVPPSQQSASAQSQDLDNTLERRQLDEEIVSAALPSSVSIADATDIEKPEADGSLGNNVIANQIAEEVVVTGSFIRRPDQTAVSAITPTLTSLAQLFRSDPDAQHDFLSLLEQTLNQSDPELANSTAASPQAANRSTTIFSGLLNSVVQPDNNGLAQRREQLIDSYEQLADPGQLFNLANLYQQLRPGYPQLQAPELLEAAIELLELINQ